MVGRPTEEVVVELRTAIAAATVECHHSAEEAAEHPHSLLPCLRHSVATELDRAGPGFAMAQSLHQVAVVDHSGSRRRSRLDSDWPMVQDFAVDGFVATAQELRSAHAATA